MALTGFRCGDNCYLDLVRLGEGPQADVLCTAPVCGDWQVAGSLPEDFKDRQVAARFGTADQLDGSGTVMAAGVPAVLDLRLPEKSKEAGTGPLGLRRGVYVLEGSGCEQPANAAVRIWNGKGLSGSATRDCRTSVTSRARMRFRVSNSCVNTYDGSRTAEAQTVTVPDSDSFRQNGQTFRRCPSSEVPKALRRLAD